MITEVVKILFVLLICQKWNVYARNDRHMVKMTLVQNAIARDAVCLDGSLPAYHLDQGFGDGARNWLLQFEGGGWCNDVKSCSERAVTRRGSTKYMDKYATFAGILSNKASKNPDFYNWNRVRLRYCDGGSFAGDAVFDDGTRKLYFRGQRIWKAIVEDLLPKGLNHANKALLSGCSAGGLATFFHCDNFTTLLPKTATVKCLSDAGFFLDVKDVDQKPTAMNFYEPLITLQGVEKFLDKRCVSSRSNPHECFFPQYALPYITTPYFVLNSAYDEYQFHHHFVPPSSDLRGDWSKCKLKPPSCTADQIHILQGFRDEMVRALALFNKASENGGLFINSCFIHCQSGSDDTWFAANSPRLNNKTIAETVGDWYFERRVSKEIDCPYPCDSTCPKLEQQRPTPGLAIHR